MANEDPRQVLEREILEDGRRKAEAIVAQARAQAEKMLAAARAEADAEAKKLLRDASARASKRTSMILNTVNQEVLRRNLQAREALIQEAFELAMARLRKLSAEEYRSAIFRLALSAMSSIRADRFVVRVGPHLGSDAALDRLADDLAAALAREGRIVSVSVQNSPTIGPGVIVESADGKMRWDNTFEARLHRMRQSLRRMAAELLFEEI